MFATGTRARDLPLPGIKLPGVFSLRKIDDVRRLRPALDDARRIAIVGGGYIGLEVAAVMRQEGRDAIVIEAEGRVMKRVAGEAVSGFFDTLHRSRGVDIRLGARLAAIDGDARATGVALASGERIAADLVLVATGARANDDLAAAAGLPCEDGIVVDDFARAARGRLCDRRLRAVLLRIATAARSGSNACRTPSIRPRPRRMRSWARPKPYDPVPWFWSDQYEIKLQITGLLDGFDACETVGNPADGKFSVEYRKGGKLIAVDAINDGRAHMLGRRRIAADLPEVAAAAASLHHGPWRAPRCRRVAACARQSADAGADDRSDGRDIAVLDRFERGGLVRRPARRAADVGSATALRKPLSSLTFALLPVRRRRTARRARR